MDLSRTWYDDRCNCTLQFDASLTDLDLEATGVRDSKNISDVFDGFEWNLVYSWDLLVWWSSYAFYFVYSIFEAENLTYVTLFKQTNKNNNNNKTFGFCLYWDIYRPISFKLGVMIGTAKLYILVSVWMALTFIQCHSCMRNQKLRCPFSRKFKPRFGLNSVCCHNLLVCWS